MDRRAFLGMMIGGVATAATVRTWPFRVYSLPTETMTVPQAIRFIRAYDVGQGEFITRFDVLYGWMQTVETPRLKLELPADINDGEILHAKPHDFLSNRDLKRFADRCIEKYGLSVPSEQIIECVETRTGHWLTAEMQRGVEVPDNDKRWGYIDKVDG